MLDIVNGLDTQVICIKEARYTCLSCGYKTLDSETGYDVCTLCGWEDDPYCWDHPKETGGPNGPESLYDSQRKFLLHGQPAFWRKEGYPDESHYEKDKDWEPFQKTYHIK
jgi:hypothetical protein